MKRVRALGTWILVLGLAATPMMAQAAGDSNGDRAGSKPGGSTDAPAKPEVPTLENQLQQLREQLRQQQHKIQALENQLKPSGVAAAPPSSAAVKSPVGADSAKAVLVPATLNASQIQEETEPQTKKPQTQIPQSQTSPLQLKVGDAYITPVGFMDFTGVWSNHNRASGIGTNFAGIPYGNNIYQTNLSESRFSMQNSRIGFRVDAPVGGAHVIGYMEADFLGVDPGNVAVTSNSNSLRSRLYWVDVRKGKWELLGGQTWSLATPNRNGDSPLPADVFYSYDMDVNYQAGMVWGRIPELRLAYHASPKLIFAAAIDSAEQYIGGSAGGGLITLPAALTGLANTQLNAGNSTLGTPNSAPDFIAKVIFEPSKFHIEVGGIERQFQTFDNPHTFSATGGAGFGNIDFHPTKAWNILTHNYWGDGGGRYIFGQAPDLIVRADGSPQPLHSGSTVDGIEYTHKNTTLFTYYGLLYVSRLAALDTNSKLVGYGYFGSPSGQNRSVQEPTLGLIQNFWKDAKYGALSLIGQYSYLTRNPWSVASGQPANAHLSMVFLDLRYTLPGSAPTLGPAGRE